MHPSQNRKRRRLPSRRAALLTTAVVGLAVALSPGCSRQHYRESADREVYGILRAKTSAVPGMLEDFTIEQPERESARDDLLAALPGTESQGAPEETVSQEGEAEGPLVISLQKALERACLNSREYQTQKESLYLSALTLTLRRYEFNPHFFGTLSGEYKDTNSGETDEVSGKSTFGFNWLLATGARLSVSVASTFKEVITRGPQKTASSLFTVAITQPLLKGAGIAVDEPLTQGKRDVVYQMRRFVRFRQTFFVSVFAEYFRVLQQMQIVNNEIANYESLQLSLDQAKSKFDAGRIADFEVALIQQRQLTAEDSVEAAKQRYENALDSFKRVLGLPTEANIALDPKDLDLLDVEGAAVVALDAESAWKIALESRLDLMTSRDQAEDAERKVEVAANDLLPGLDLSATLATDTERPNEPLDFHLRRTDLTAGFELDLPLDKLSERNQYRKRLIESDRAQRSHQELRDRIVLEVRRLLREYARNRSRIDIQKASLELARRRRESITMLFDAGRADTREVLDAADALLDAQNAVSTARVDYKVASLELARDMGILIVDEKGQLKEDFDAYQ